MCLVTTDHENMEFISSYMFLQIAKIRFVKNNLTKLVLSQYYIYCFCSEIIEEEAQLEQVTNRRFNSIPIQRDPDAPAKPTRDFTAGVVPGMVRVPSNSSTGKMSSSNSHTTEGGGLSDHGTDNMRDVRHHSSRVCYIVRILLSNIGVDLILESCF